MKLSDAIFACKLEETKLYFAEKTFGSWCVCPVGAALVTCGIEPQIIRDIVEVPNTKSDYVAKPYSLLEGMIENLDESEIKTSLMRIVTNEEVTIINKHLDYYSAELECPLGNVHSMGLPVYQLIVELTDELELDRGAVVEILKAIDL